jgi:hypothetical protein
MSKIALKDTIKLAPKIVIKKEEKNIEETEKAVSKIHSTQGNTVRVSLDFPESLYTEVKMKVATERKTLREYLLSLVAKDIEVD